MGKDRARTYFGLMFDEWKNAWQQAVDNFERELRDPDEHFSPNQRASAMRRDLAAARNALNRLSADLDQARKDLAGEEESEQTARRRAEMARRIDDADTVRIALDFAGRHAHRAGILRRKVDVLQDELAMRQEELGIMEQHAAEEIEKIEAEQLTEADFRKLEAREGRGGAAGGAEEADAMRREAMRRFGDEARGDEARGGEGISHGAGGNTVSRRRHLRAWIATLKAGRRLACRGSAYFRRRGLGIPQPSSGGRMFAGCWTASHHGSANPALFAVFSSGTFSCESRSSCTKPDRCSSVLLAASCVGLWWRCRLHVRIEAQGSRCGWPV
jgi:hypothetical protein